VLIHAPQGKCRSDLIARFEKVGIDPARIEFVGRQSRREYVQTYHRIDIALDPFPHGGGITTCDALWMGVPVVSLRGKTAVGRGGASILSAVGLHECVAMSNEEYRNSALNLAADPTRLEEIRSNLRSRMTVSQLMKMSNFVSAIEEVYSTLLTRAGESRSP
jgi:predicted O-linked N-acetylglucosamine transferase (SPINDLY family)